jgi:hypothetical protein
MQSTEKRVAALEAKSTEGNASFNLVLAEDGETQAAALERAGFASNAADVVCVMFISPEDAKL